MYTKHTRFLASEQKLEKILQGFQFDLTPNLPQGGSSDHLQERVRRDLRGGGGVGARGQPRGGGRRGGGGDLARRRLGERLLSGP